MTKPFMDDKNVAPILFLLALLCLVLNHFVPVLFFIYIPACIILNILGWTILYRTRSKGTK